MYSQLLSAEVQGGLKSFHVFINAEMTKKVISNAIKMALHPSTFLILEFLFTFLFTNFYLPYIYEYTILFLDVPGNPEIYATKADYTKQAECAVLTLMFVAIKHGWDSQIVRNVLEELSVSEEAAEVIVGVFDEHQADLSVQNLTTGHSLPYLTNVEWKLTCEIKSSQSDAKKAGDLNFTVSLVRFREVTGELEPIAEFKCSVEELQALVSKLKEIERHCEKLATIAK